MPLNASIFGNMLNAPKSPEEYAAERENMLAARNTNALNAQKVDEYKAGLAEKSALGNLLAQPGFNVMSPESQAQVYRAAPRSGAAFLKGIIDNQEGLTKIDKEKALTDSAKASAGKDTNEANLKTWQSYRDQSSMVNDLPSAQAYLINGYHDPVIGPYLKRLGTLEEGLKRIPQDPAGFEAWRNGLGMKVDQLAQHALQQREFDLKAKNELIGPDGKPNNTLIGVKTGLAKAGAASTNVNVSTGQKGFDNELKLRGDFKQEPVYKAHQEMQSAYSQIQQSLKQATPAGDLAGATKIMKLLDPGSVVRESELGMAMAATGLLDRAQNYASNIISGNKLTPKQRQEFQKLADALYGESIKQYNSKQSEYKKLGAEYGLNADRAIGAPASLAAQPMGGNSGGVVDFGSLK